MWNSIKDIICTWQKINKNVTYDDTQKAVDLNFFFLSFDTQNYNQECLQEFCPISTSDQGGNRLLIDFNYVQSLFKLLRPKKSAGPDGLLLFIKSLCRGTVPGLVLKISKVY